MSGWHVGQVWREPVTLANRAGREVAEVLRITKLEYARVPPGCPAVPEVVAVCYRHEAFARREYRRPFVDFVDKVKGWEASS